MSDRIMAPDSAVKEFDTRSGRRYIQNTDGSYTVPYPGDRKEMLKFGECFVPKIRSVGRGYRCPNCGFLALFPHDCGRCGCEDLILEEP